MAKKSKRSKTTSGKGGDGKGGTGGGTLSAVETKKSLITLQALQDEPDSDSDDHDAQWPPETEWNADAKALKKAIEAGAYDKLLDCKDEKSYDEDFEEADLEEDDHVDQEEEEEDEIGQEDDDDDDNDEIDQENDDHQEDLLDDENDDTSKDEDTELQQKPQQSTSSRKNAAVPLALEQTHEIGDDDKDGEEDDDDDDGDNDDDDESDEETSNHPGLSNTLQNTRRALQVVGGAMVAEKSEWPWAEKFSVLTATPLPFDETKNGQNGADDTLPPTSIHDDLQREVAFYDLALEAVEQAKLLCRESDVVFSRPDDFLAEMVKTDEHMAKVKDRLIFESKKMEAVAQRKANKEQKLRSKESHSNKLAEKAKKKRDHFQAVEAWAESAQANRGRGLVDRDDGNSFFQSPGKKRARADEKFGHGGKRGRFKQNDPKELNDMSSFNRRGNFGGLGTKKSSSTKSKAGAGAGANRKGKRARDASRSR